MSRPQEFGFITAGVSMLALTMPMVAQAQDQRVNMDAPASATSTAPPGKKVATGEIV